jgi:organic hydroperoxide reductase OsmC/OhrA
MARAKTYRFPVDVGWAGGRLTQVSVAGKHELRVATPPEFRGGTSSGVWSPEDLFVAAAATCYVLDLDVVLETDPGPEAEARSAAEAAERGCLVAASLDTPVRVALDVRAAAAA